MAQCLEIKMALLAKGRGGGAAWLAMSEREEGRWQKVGELEGPGWDSRQEFEP